MQIEQLMEKTEQVQYGLILLLQGELQPIGFKEVISHTGLSKVTLMKYVDGINERFTTHQLDAYLRCQDNQIYLYQGADLTQQDLLKPFLQDAIKYHILMHLFHKEHFTIQKLAQDLLISEATLNRHLAGLNQLLLEFDLAIVQGYLLGSEHQRRYFYYELFLQTLGQEALRQQMERFDASRAVTLVERLCTVSLSEEKAHRLKLWFSISQQRLSAQRKDFKQMDLLIEPYSNHVFFQRLDRAVLHYFSRFAVEFDRGEAELLFAFLSSQFILPVQTIEYILGFGGPISDSVTEGIALLRQNGLIQGKTNEQVIYVLGQLVGQAYFFKGAIRYPSNASDLKTLLTPDLQKVLELLNGMMMPHLSDQTTNALCERIHLELIKFILFLKEESQSSLLVGLDMGDNHVEESFLLIVLGNYLENNRFIHLEPYQKSIHYDCVISQTILGDYGQAKVYRLKNQFAERELRDMALFLKNALQQKNETPI